MYLLYLKTRGFKPGTLKDTRKHLDTFDLWLNEIKQQDIKQITVKTIREYQLYLKNEYRKHNAQPIASITIIIKLHTLKRYFKYLVKHKEILLDPSVDIELPKGREYLPKHILSQEEAERLLSVPAKTAMDIRNKAILELLYSTGMRGQELCNLDIYDLNLKDRSIHIRIPKNRKDRIVPIGEKAKQAVENYLLTSRMKLCKHVREKAVFISLSGTRITQKALRYLVKKYIRKLRLDKNIGVHSIRHSCATHLLENGSNLRIIQQLLGHTSPRSTEIYTRIVPQELKTAISRYHPRERMRVV
ncbi:MAG: tyrosine-type recombinase/integrase [Candidatus Omnitrophica bacterium]|nr:tyrosine-type recombinase/integrase [Candidatus Omnitrophota bacterium]